MASVLKKVCLSLLVFVMMMFGGMLALLGILIVILMHPLTAFKKITRNGGCMWHNNYVQKWYTEKNLRSFISLSYLLVVVQIILVIFSVCTYEEAALIPVRV